MLLTTYFCRFSGTVLCWFVPFDSFLNLVYGVGFPRSARYSFSRGCGSVFVLDIATIIVLIDSRGLMGTIGLVVFILFIHGESFDCWKHLSSWVARILGL